MPDLSGMVMLVTGAGRGIGRGIAEVAAELGANVAINARTTDYVDELAARIQTRTGRRVVPIVADVTTAAGAAAAVEHTHQEFGRLDILVNNLGDAISKPLALLPGDDRDAMSDQEVEQVLALNLGAALACTRAAAPHLLAQRGGRVINVSSFAALAASKDLAVYVAAKTAIIGLTRALALEWAPHGVTVNAIAPGVFPDPVTLGDEYEDAVAAASAETPLGRGGDPREVGYAASFLASSEAAYITGQTLVIDGGRTL